MSRRFEIDLALRGHDEGATGLLGSVEAGLKRVNQEARMSGELSLKRAIREGPSSLLELGGANLALGGFAIEQGAKMLGDYAEKLAEIRAQFKEGKIDAAEMVEKIGEGVPILGEVWKAGRSIHGLLTGETAELAEQNQQTKELNDQIEYRNKILEHTRQISHEWGEETRRVTSEINALNAAPGQKSIVAAKDAAAEAVEKLKHKYAVDSGEQTEDGEKGQLITIQEALTREKQKIGGLQKQLEDAKAADAANAKAVEDAGKNSVTVGGISLSFPNVMRDTSGLEAATKALNDQSAMVQNLQANYDALAGTQKKVAEQMGPALQKATERGNILVRQAIEGFLAARRELEDKGIQELNDARSRDREAALRSNGDGLDADLEAIRRAGDDKAAELDRQLQEEAKAGMDSLEERKRISDLKILNEADAGRQIDEITKKYRDDQKAKDAAEIESARKEKIQGQIDQLQSRNGPNRGELLSSRFQGDAEAAKSQREQDLERLRDELKNGAIKNTLDKTNDLLQQIFDGGGGNFVTLRG